MLLSRGEKSLFSNFHSTIEQARLDRSFHFVKRAPVYGKFNGSWDIPRAFNDDPRLLSGETGGFKRTPERFCMRRKALDTQTLIGVFFQFNLSRERVLHATLLRLTPDNPHRLA